MIKNISIIIITLFVCSCSKKNIHIPDGYFLQRFTGENIVLNKYKLNLENVTDTNRLMLDIRFLIKNNNLKIKYINIMKGK